MKLSNLKQFLDNEIDAGFFRNLITEEISDYRKQLAKIGSSCPITFEEDEQIIFDNKHLETLGSAFVNGQLDEVELDYIANALLLTYYGDSENVTINIEIIKDHLEDLSNADINGPLTISQIEKMLSH